jgi:hypothetical protein
MKLSINICKTGRTEGLYAESYRLELFISMFRAVRSISFIQNSTQLLINASTSEDYKILMVKVDCTVEM